MKFFIDTAEIADIRDLAASGLVDGVTTNPSLVAKSGRKFLEVVKEICDIVPGPVSAEVAATDYSTMLAEGKHLAKIAKNVTVKVPLTPDGLKVCKALSSEGTMVNVTLCFSGAQAILAVACGQAGLVGVGCGLASKPWSYRLAGAAGGLIWRRRCGDSTTGGITAPGGGSTSKSGCCCSSSLRWSLWRWSPAC